MDRKTLYEILKEKGIVTEDTGASIKIPSTHIKKANDYIASAIEENMPSIVSPRWVPIDKCSVKQGKKCPSERDNGVCYLTCSSFKTALERGKVPQNMLVALQIGNIERKLILDSKKIYQSNLFLSLYGQSVLNYPLFQDIKISGTDALINHGKDEISSLPLKPKLQGMNFDSVIDYLTESHPEATNGCWDDCQKKCVVRKTRLVACWNSPYCGKDCNNCKKYSRLKYMCDSVH